MRGPGRAFLAAILLTHAGLPAQEKKEEYPWWTGTEDRKIIEAEKKKQQPKKPRAIPWHDGIVLTEREYSYLKPLEDLTGARLIGAMPAYATYKMALLKNRQKQWPMGISIIQGMGWDKPQWALHDWEWRFAEMYRWMDKQEKKRR